MDKRVIDTIYADKKAYVERDLAAVLRPLEDFDSIEYARDVITNEEFIKLAETIGAVWFINVTGYTEELILKAVCKMIMSTSPAGLVRTRDRMRAASRLFRGGSNA